MDSATTYVTQHKRIYINIGKKHIKSKMCNKIKCAIQYTVDLVNNDRSRNVHCGSSGPWWLWSYGMGRHMLWTTNTGAFY